jgi:CRP-like cAMP-binding protein
MKFPLLFYAIFCLNSNIKYNWIMQILPVTQEAKINTLRGSPYFASLGERVLDSLGRGATLRSYDRSEVICWQDEPGTALYILQHGSVKLFKLSPKGRELIIRVLENGATFNEVPVFDLGLTPVNAAALEPSEIWSVDAQVIRQAMREHPEMAQLIILNLAHNLRALVSVVEDLSFCQVTNRLARLINRMPSEQLEETRLTQDQLAARLGTVREVVARSLRDLERSGAIRVERRQIHVLNETVLKDWAGVEE